jgi:hypothetical protein
MWANSAFMSGELEARPLLLPVLEAGIPLTPVFKGYNDISTALRRQNVITPCVMMRESCSHPFAGHRGPRRYRHIAMERDRSAGIRAWCYAFLYDTLFVKKRPMLTDSYLLELSLSRASLSVFVSRLSPRSMSRLRSSSVADLYHDDCCTVLGNLLSVASYQYARHVHS